jgi:predicted lipid-binding transport protein (Tim44 family)
MTLSRLRPLLAAFAIFAALAFVATDADARSGKGGSAGSRGSRTFSAPPPTATAPNTAAPINRTMTQPSAATRPAAGAPAGAPAQTGFFKRPGFLGGLAAGLLGAGLLGMLFGQGLFGNLAGFASILGFIVQLALIGGVAWLLLRWWQRRSQPAPAYAGGPAPRQTYDEPQQPTTGEPQQRTMLGNLLGGGLGGAATGAAQQSPIEIEVKSEDFDTFERLLGEIQAAYGREDLAALRARVTPEMLSYFSEELAENASRGVVNEISDVKLLQGDLAESWREGETEYATVAMRFELKEAFVDRASRKVVEGDPEKPIEVTELWTFMRARGGNWLLSAIQQAE